MKCVSNTRNVNGDMYWWDDKNLRPQLSRAWKVRRAECFSVSSCKGVKVATVYVQYTNNCTILIIYLYILQLLHVLMYVHHQRELPLCVLLSYIKIYMICDICQKSLHSVVIINKLLKTFDIYHKLYKVWCNSAGHKKGSLIITYMCQNV
jgi:hypothetical protein